MSNETTPPATPPEQPPAALETPTSPFKEDGTLVENWQSLAPEGYEELRESKTLPRIKKFWDVAKSYEHVRKQVPLDKMPRPTENFTESDWNEFYDAGGRPETPADYGIKRHPDIPEEAFTDEMIEKFAAVLHKRGASQLLVDDLIDLNDELTLGKMKSMTQDEENADNERADKLYQQFGQATNQRTRWSEKAIDRGVAGSDELRAFVAQEINQKDKIVPWAMFLSNIESHFAEHGIAEEPNIPTPADYDTKIREAQGLNISDSTERAKHPYWNGKHPEHERQVQLVKQLIEAKNKNKKAG